MSELRKALWKFHVCGFKEKKRDLFLRLSIGYDFPVLHYQRSRKEKQSMNKGMSFSKDSPISSATVRTGLSKICDCLISRFEEINRLPQHLSLQITFADLSSTSKSNTLI